MELALPMGPVEMIALDLDGTLLRSDNTLSAASIAAVREAIGLGVRVVIATGRPPRAAIDIHRQLGLDTLMIAHNGAVVTDPATGKILLHRPLEAGLARRVVELARLVDPSLALGVEVLDQLHTDTISDRHRKEPTLGTPRGHREDLAAILDDFVTKVVLLGEPATLHAVQERLARAMDGEIAFAYSHERLLQVVRHDVDKARALSRVAKYYRIPKARVMAVGDAPNDLGMLRWAGLAVAPRNGWGVVRKAAHFVVAANDEDGVARAIRQYALAGARA